MAEDYLSRDNQMRSDALSSRVSLLKSLAIDIEGETKDQNVFLDETEKEMVAAGNYLQRGRKRVGQILAAGKRDRRTLLYVAVGVALFLYTTYALLRRVAAHAGAPTDPVTTPPLFSTGRH
ncbi:BET1-like protein [Paramacrobiotus metropolitanus]|uniref:BET1-like protein n=1 Tax=Paramacrobiotus metropolitanus TaxID=2943436 RepID=UPI0024464446|nr:BET1-like protein [Paramacrobiotus metropolitanus]